MIDSFLFIALPYLAAVICVGGTIVRIRTAPFTYSSLSSQFLERKSLLWGSVPWHIGIMLIVLGHGIAFICPSFWQALMSQKEVLLATEVVGLSAGIVCLVGLLVLLARRLLSPKIQAVTSMMDLLVLALLIGQVALGVVTAVHYKYGASWISGTATPYLWSLVTLQPDLSFIEDMPHAVKAHIVGAYLILLVIPFSRLIHMFAAPIHYLIRPPQNVIWNNARRSESAGGEVYVQEEARREFIKGAAGITLGCGVLAVGTFDKAYNFFFGPRLSPKEEEEIMALRLKRLQSTADQRKLELERQTSKYILVSPLSELSGEEGKYFIDFAMGTAMAFAGEDGLPILMSAKCTHLGCTVGNEADDKGRVLCPCHVSFFDIKTGQPNADAPAKKPLPMLSWVIMDKQGKIITRRSKSGEVTGVKSASALKDSNVYIVRGEEQV